MASLQSIPKLQDTNWKAAIFWGILLGLLGFGLLQYREPILAWLSNPQLNFTQWIQKLTFNNIVTFLKEYGFLITGAAAAFTFIYGFYQKHQANKAALELFTAQQNANSEITTAYTSAEQYKQLAESYKTKYEAAAASGTQDALFESQNLVTAKEEQIKNLQGQVQAISRMANIGETEMVSKLRQKGYTVEKKVVVP